MRTEDPAMFPIKASIPVLSSLSSWLYIILVVSPLFVVFSKAVFIPADPSLPSLAQKATIEDYPKCQDEFRCRTRLDQSKCAEADTCTSTQSCNGRSDYPLVEYPLQQHWQMPDLSGSCVITEGIPSSFTSHIMTSDNKTTLTMNGSLTSVTAPCYAKKNSFTGDAFTLTFWLTASCLNCSVLELSQVQKSSLQVRVVNGLLCVNSECRTNNHLDKRSWNFVVVRVYKGALSVFEDGEKLNLTNADLLSVDLKNIFVGSTEAISNISEFSLFDLRFYGDILTSREMKELQDGLVDSLVDSCRCPANYPILKNDECQNENGESHPLYNATVELNTVSVVLDPNSKSSWASPEDVNITLVLDLHQTYQIESVTVDFLLSPPAIISLYLLSDGVERTRKMSFTCSTSSCEVSLKRISLSQAIDEYPKSVADGIKIMMERESNLDTDSFIINNITIIGRCDCNGNADACVVTSNSYTCECNTNSNTHGPNCKSCIPNFLRKGSEFDCPHSCQCSQDGAVNKSDSCDPNGGQCRCKDRVDGLTCSECKPWTYGLEASKQSGCSPCNCYQSGSDSCNNVTGVCACKANTQTGMCSSCKINHFGLETSEGCRPCDCDASGTVSQSLTCDTTTGDCHCKGNVEGRTCDVCKPGFYNLDAANVEGCESCYCHQVGMDHNLCDETSGQCVCRNGEITDKHCTPKIISVDPRFGPVAGGTQVTIHGKLLGNSSHGLSVFIGQTQQDIYHLDDNVVIINTKAFNSSLGLTKKLQMKFGWTGVSSSLIATSFSYWSDPVLDPSKAVDIFTFKSGGCLVKVYGTNLDSVKYPRLEIFNKNMPAKVSRGECTHFPGKVVCQTPGLSHLYISASDEFNMKVVFDGVTSSSMGKLDVKEDPVIDYAGNVKFQYPFEKTITLYGEELTSACRSNDYTVLIGVVACTIKDISNSHIECKPTASNPGNQKKHVLKVNIGNINKTIGTVEYLEFYETTGFIIIISCLAAIIVTLLVIIIICCCYRRRCGQHNNTPHLKYLDSKDQSHSRQMNTYSDLTTIVSSSSNNNGHSLAVRMESVIREPKKGIVNSEAETTALMDEFLPHVELGIRDVVKSCFIGHNSFSVGTMCTIKGKQTQVVDGSLKRNGAVVQTLTIKSLLQQKTDILKPSSSSSDALFLPWANAALNECLRLRHFKHNHVLTCVGIGVDQEHFHLLYPHMKQGTLKSLAADTTKDFSARQLLGFSQQVAEGIDFLASKNITHKDVAARNCMVDKSSIVKIGDSSFSWDLFPDEYVYNEERERYLPLRWMAPESISDGYYDMRTDVWSFGILVWELLTRGCMPFHEVKDQQVADYVLNGYVLGKPETSSDKLYDVLHTCWSPEIENRPSITLVSKSFNSILEAEDNGTYANSYTVSSQLAPKASPRQGHSFNAHIYSAVNLSHV